MEPASGAIDVCIRFGAGHYPDVGVERLTEERVSPVCTALYLDRHELREPSDLTRCRLLHDDVLLGHPDHIGWAEWLEAAGAPEVDTAGVHFSHSHLARDAAASGQGVALARSSLVRRQLEMGHLVTPFDVSTPRAWTTGSSPRATRHRREPARCSAGGCARHWAPKGRHEHSSGGVAIEKVSAEITLLSRDRPLATTMELAPHEPGDDRVTFRTHFGGLRSAGGSKPR